MVQIVKDDPIKPKIYEFMNGRIQQTDVLEDQKATQIWWYKWTHTSVNDIILRLREN